MNNEMARRTLLKWELYIREKFNFLYRLFGYENKLIIINEGRYLIFLAIMFGILFTIIILIILYIIIALTGG